MKKFVSMLLALVMVFSLSVPVMAADTTTIYFENTGRWSSVNAYYWSDGDITGPVTWPGPALTHIEDNIWSIEVPTSADNIIFNNGSGTQTDDMTIPTDGKNLYNYGTGTWSTYGSAGGPTVTGNTTGDVTASYTPSAETVAEAKWGTSAESLTESGTFAEALAAAAAADSTVAYIQLQSNVTTESGSIIQSGVFTLDLNGKTLSNSNSYTIDVRQEGTVVTLTDSASGGMVSTSEIGASAVTAGTSGKVVLNGGSYSGNGPVFIGTSGICEINGGTFSTSSHYAVSSGSDSVLTINGGTFSGHLAAIAANGTVNITGGTFNEGSEGHFSYYGGKLDLSGYNANGLTLSQWTDAVLTVSSENIALPAGSTFKDDSGNAVTTLANCTIYTIGTETPSAPTYTVTVGAEPLESGTVTTDKTAAAEGETVTLTVTPAEGYQLDTLTVTDAEGNPVEVTGNTFTMPAGNVIINATFKEGLAVAEITGVSITVDGTTYTEGNVTIKPDSTITLTVHGTNLQNGTMDNHVDYAFGCGDFLNPDLFTFSDDGTTATMTPPASDFSNSSNYEIVYYNNYTADDRTQNPTGIYVTYDDGSTEPEVTAKITGVKVYVNDAEVTEPGEIIITEGDTLKVVYSGENFDKLTEDYQYRVAGWTSVFSADIINAENNTATVSYVASQLTGSNKHSIAYTNAGEDQTDTGYTVTYLEKRPHGLTTIYFKNTAGWTEPMVYFVNSWGSVLGQPAVLRLLPGETNIYSAAVPVNQWVYALYFFDNAASENDTGALLIPTDGSNQYNMDGSWSTFTATVPETTSANIVWGSMSFTYTDGEDGAEGAWSCEEDANKITVTNTGNKIFTAQPSYKNAEGYEEITGKFYNSMDAAQSNTIGVSLGSGESWNFYLKLSNKPSKALNGDKIGTVTIDITEGSPE